MCRQSMRCLRKEIIHIYQHPNIRFTMDIEENKKRPFLDVTKKADSKSLNVQKTNTYG